MNNDRFKCRYWHKPTNRYLRSAKLVYNDGTYTQVGTKQTPDGCCHSYIVAEHNTFDVVPEQCTGLKDKNGNLIYEGDIVFLNGEKWQVVWVDEDCAFFLSSLKETYQQPIYPDLYIMADDFKVIGNIHNNKELLK